MDTDAEKSNSSNSDLIGEQESMDRSPVYESYGHDYIWCSPLKSLTTNLIQVPDDYSY